MGNQVGGELPHLGVYLPDGLAKLVYGRRAGWCFSRNLSHLFTSSVNVFSPAEWFPIPLQGLSYLG
jgi:hypothetical protein